MEISICFVVIFFASFPKKIQQISLVFEGGRGVWNQKKFLTILFPTFERGEGVKWGWDNFPPYGLFFEGIPYLLLSAINQCNDVWCDHIIQNIFLFQTIL